MRVRNRKGATELLEAHPQYVILNPADAKKRVENRFGGGFAFDSRCRSDLVFHAHPFRADRCDIRRVDRCCAKRNAAFRRCRYRQVGRA